MNLEFINHPSDAIVCNGDVAGGATVTNVVLEGAPAAPALARREPQGRSARRTTTPEETAETMEVAAKWPKEPLPGETGEPGQWAPGLVAEIFEGKGYTRPVAVRIDPTISFRYGEMASHAWRTAQKALASQDAGLLQQAIAQAEAACRYCRGEQAKAPHYAAAPGKLTRVYARSWTRALTRMKKAPR